MNLGQEAVDALRALGLQIDLRGHFRWSHAFIATVGAGASGTDALGAGAEWWGLTQEASDAIRPSQVSAGIPLTEPRLTGQVYEVSFVK
jgi:hypothetical protein